MPFDPEFIPPRFVGMLQLAAQTNAVIRQYESTTQVGSELERRFWDVCRALGFRVIELGHKKKGIEYPDAIAYHRHGGAISILADTKSSKKPYKISVQDRRTFETYSKEFKAELQKKGESSFLLIVARQFKGDSRAAIKHLAGLRTASGVALLNGVVLMKVADLLYLLEVKLKHPFLDPDFFEILLKRADPFVDEKLINKVLAQKIDLDH